MKAKTKTPFHKLTAAQKRVAIAKDVLKQITTHRVKITRGVFARSKLDSQPRALYDQKSLLALRTCRACAVGAAIVSGIRLFNKHSPELITEPDAMRTWFSKKQMVMIEQAFECGMGWWREFEREQLPAIKFGKRFSDNKKRARAIFGNIIANKGQFKP